MTGWLLLAPLSGCDRAATPPPPSPPPAAAAPPPATTVVAVTHKKPEPDPVGACAAASLDHREPFDARDEASLKRCVSVATGDPRGAKACGQGEVRALDLARIDRAVRPIDSRTRAHLRAVAERGEKLGRKRRVFGLVGDSMTVSHAFLRDLSSLADRGPTVLAPEPRRALLTTVGGQADATILDFYRGVEAVKVQGVWRDSFSAPRAAKIGMRTPWALKGGPHSPVARMVKELSPAVALVLYGGNDAAYRPVPPEQVAADFERDMTRLVDALEQQGIVVVLHTLPRHGDSPGFDDCGPASAMTDWRLAVHTNAVSARAAELACRLELPLVDLRDAFDAIENRGLGSDGVHPSVYRRGGGVLDARGLQCGYNLRNYLTLRMLVQLKQALGW